MSVSGEECQSCLPYIIILYIMCSITNPTESLNETLIKFSAAEWTDIDWVDTVAEAGFSGCVDIITFKKFLFNI